MCPVAELSGCSGSCVSLQPTKVLGIYTFTKRVALEEFENKPRKQQGYSTVSHFNIVHYDCHLAAVRYVLPFPALPRGFGIRTLTLELAMGGLRRSLCSFVRVDVVLHFHTQENVST